MIFEAFFLRSKLSFGSPSAPTFAAGGIVLALWGHPEGPWEHQKGHLEVRSRIYISFARISEPYFESSADAVEHNWCFFCYACFQALFPSLNLVVRVSERHAIVPEWSWGIRVS